MAGRFDGNTLSLENLGSFPNDYVRLAGVFYSSFLQLMSGVQEGMRKASSIYGPDFAGIGIDSMGVSFGTLDQNGHLLSNPLYTRTPQEKEIVSAIFDSVGREELYGITGLQLTKLNSLYHLMRLLRMDSPVIRNARTFMMMPDLINYFLTGRITSEYTISTTSHLMNAASMTWDAGLIERLGLDPDIFPAICPAGSVVGKLKTSLSEESGLARVPVISTASHDTAAALAFVPSQGGRSVYISSGTWGMMGVDQESPIICGEGMKENFANEGGAFGNIRYIHNSLNLWILKECRIHWEGEGLEMTWDELSVAAEKAPPFQSFIDPGDPVFLLSRDMPDTIRAWCHRTGQKVPGSVGEIVRCIYESLALKFRYTYDSLCSILDWKPESLNIVGGGGKDPLLSQMTANAVGIPVVCGPYDATAMGNILMQMIAKGEISNRDEGLEILMRSCVLKNYEPINRDRWEDTFAEYKRMISQRKIEEEDRIVD